MCKKVCLAFLVLAGEVVLAGGAVGLLVAGFLFIVPVAAAGLVHAFA